MVKGRSYFFMAGINVVRLNFPHGTCNAGVYDLWQYCTSEQDQYATIAIFTGQATLVRCIHKARGTAENLLRWRRTEVLGL